MLYAFKCLWRRVLRKPHVTTISFYPDTFKLTRTTDGRVGLRAEVAPAIWAKGKHAGKCRITIRIEQ